MTKKLGHGSAPGIVAIVALTASLILSSAQARAEPRGPRSDGELLYQLHCLTCHGESGKGNGPMARILKIKPANLRRLSARNGGTFPAKEMYHVIDGRRAISGHGSKEMPLWGYAFQDLEVDLNQEKEVRVKIVALIGFLESLQEPAGRARKTPPAHEGHQGGVEPRSR